MDDIYQKYDAVLRENEQLKQELKRLKMQIGQFTPQAAQDNPASPAVPQDQPDTYEKEQKESAHANKQEVKIYDYIDLQVPVLMSMYKKRVKGYRKMGYRGAEL